MNPSSGVLITRPLHQAQCLAQRLGSLGIKHWIFPALDIFPREPDPASLEFAHHAHGWIFISANAVQQGWPWVKPGTEPAWLAAIGQTTAGRLREVSSRQVLHPQHGADSEALLALPEFQQLDGIKIAIFRGRGGREWLKQTLIQRGATVVYVECYERQRPVAPTPELATALAQNATIQVQSTEALHNLWELCSPVQRQTLRQCTFIVSHPRIASAVSALGLPTPVVLPNGDDALIEWWTSHQGPENP
ncbi:MAG: uroporphyrinogen-III synthase [Ferrovum sp.]|nr:uroporphyrinogen-III synthase [Ferrovum sp.]NDU88160.1 uroporphyrinogen-III synthase [Ferrovum sp.]